MVNCFQKQKLILQIGVILLFGFGLSLWLSVQLLSYERSDNLKQLSSFSTVNRITSLIGILEQAPVRLHQEIINATASTDLMLSLDRLPKVSRTENAPDEMRDLIEHIQSTNVAEVRLHSSRNERIFVDMSTMRQAMMSHHMRKNAQPGEMRYVVSLTGSIQLLSGRWLNFSSAVNEAVTQWSWSVLGGLMIVIITTFVASIWTINRTLRPVSRLTEAAKRIGIEKDFSPIETQGPSDLIPAFNAFNDMQSQLSSYIEDRTKLIAAISHDLRTPLTSLRLRLEFMEQGEDKQQVLNTLTMMEKMLNATMAFARQNAEIEEKQHIDLDSLLESIIDEYADKGIEISYSDKLAIQGYLPPISLRRMLENLINNSVQYAGEQAKISISVQRAEQQLFIAIFDTGCGIDTDKYAEVLKPFVRLDSARDIATSNVGLGLSITQSLIQNYGGSLVLSENKPSGLVATLNFPNFKSE